MTKNPDSNPESAQDAEVTQGGTDFRIILKPKYEPPVVVSLGELARCSGFCITGSANRDGCTNGLTAGISCTRGGTVIP